MHTLTPLIDILNKSKTYFLVLLISLLSHTGLTQNHYVDSLKIILSNTSQPAEQFDLYNKIAEDIFTNGNGNIDSSSCIQMLKIAQQLNNDSMMAIGYNMAGNYFLINHGNYNDALEYFFKAIPLAQNAEDKRRISSLYIDISVVYHKLNNNDEQIRYLRKAVENLPDKTSPQYYFLLCQVQYYMCRYFVLQQKNDSALHYGQALNESNLYLKSTIYKAASESLMGNIYDRQGDNALAEIHHQNASRIVDSMTYLYIKLEVKPSYIDFLLKNNQVSEARKQALQLMNIGMKKNIADVKRIAAGFLRKISEANHQTDSAYFYSRLESDMKDSVFNQNNINKIQSLAFNEQLRIIEEEGKRNEQERQRKQNIQYAIIALGIITFIIFFLLLSRRHITNTNHIRFLGVIALLLVFEFLNLLLHPFLEHITHHSPVLILLALVCIASLLVPLHHKLEKWVINKLVEKNKQIRLAAARKTIELLEKDNS